MAVGHSPQLDTTEHPTETEQSSRRRGGLPPAVLYEQALALYDRGRFADSLERIDAAQAVSHDTSGGCAPDAELLGNLFLLQGACHYALRDFEEALRLYNATRETLDVAEFPDDYVGRVSPLVNLGLLHFRKGQLREAMEHYKEAQRLVERHYCTDRMAVADLYHNIAVVYDAQNQLPRALEFYKKALRIRERFEPTREQQLLLALTKENVAMVWRDQDNTAEAVKMMQSVLSIRRRYNGSDSVEYASSLFNLGLLHFDMARVNSALGYFRRCAEIRRQLLGESSTQTAVALRYVEELEKRNHRTVASSPWAFGSLPYRTPSPSGVSSTIAASPRGAGHWGGSTPRSAGSENTGPPVTLAQLRSPSPASQADRLQRRHTEPQLGGSRPRVVQRSYSPLLRPAGQPPSTLQTVRVSPGRSSPQLFQGH
eukprot:TRINITY_DN47101_c0_g1_i1.p1 TRINITY_DN47101_c0_g1~~TRINITY_DN47101_c0_g1_i1.p1  ORF type:complete len:427 (+),score=108.37 TRINITY_DN47101_c0_g1_i1:56-1336(+)